MSADPARLQASIEAAYIVSGNTLGWRFLASPVDVLYGAAVAFVGLHPGGRARPDHHAEFCMATATSAYADEVWSPATLPGRHPLQQQVLSLFARLGVEPSAVLAGNLIPFRSPDWASLAGRNDALKFGLRLWRETIQAARPTTVIAMGHHSFQALYLALGASVERKVELGWGRVTGPALGSIRAP